MGISREKMEKKRGGASKNIKPETWREHFMNLLGGKNVGPEDRDVGERNLEEGGDIRLEEKEIDEALKNLKKKKAAGKDKIKNEAWIHGGEKKIDKLKKGLFEIWEGKFWPEEWKEGVIMPIHKKGSKERVENYRGITLTCSSYKVFADVLNKKIVKEIEEKGGWGETQAGFRKGRGCADNIFTLRHAVDENLTRKGDKVYALFLDLKAAFDNVDRDLLWKAMRNVGVSEGLIKRVRWIYRETKSRVLVGGDLSEEFWTEKGVMQGCPLSPTLFNIFLADLEKRLGRGQEGGLVVGGEKIWSLAYADDTVLLAKDEAGMREMMRGCERYMDHKKLTVNVSKTKMMVFSRGGKKGRKKERTWKWKNEIIEEVDEFEYLGFIFKNDNSLGAHVRSEKGETSYGHTMEFLGEAFRW